jgi:hypothetical protein
MVYSPKLSERASATIRSFSFALGKPMTKAVERAVEILPLIIHPVLVCQKCRDKTRCAVCAFSDRAMPAEVRRLLNSQA